MDFSSEIGFRKLYQDHYAQLHRTAYNVVGTSEVAEDVVHQVFLKIWEKRSDLKISGEWSHYLTRSVINTALNYLKQQQKTASLDLAADYHAELSAQDEPDDDQQAINNQIRQIVESLPERCQLVFCLSRYEGMSNQEIADYLEVSKKTVENQLNKAFSRLREQMKPYLSYLSQMVLLCSGINFF